MEESRLNYNGQIKRTVLVVDDEEINLNILGEILKDKYNVLFAKDGAEALTAIRGNKDSLSAVLLDLLMPKIDGFGVMETMKADDELKRLPVIVLTSDEKSEVRCLEMGAADFIRKPYDMPEVIIARIQRIIELFEDRSIIQSTERDDFTGLFSELYFYEYAAMMDRYHPNLEMDAIVLDIDHFHLVNELYGRSYGDRILKTVAITLRRYAEGNGGIAAREKNDVFMLYIPRQKNAQKLKAEVEKDLLKEVDSSRIRVRIGVCSQGNDEKIEERFERAKRACDTIRDKYNLSVAVYDSELQKKSLFAERLIGDLSEGIQKRQFKVYYQPKFGIQGDEPVLEAAEALVRWEHPEFGLVSPGVFIPLFEENGLIQFVDKFVWREAASKIRLWKDKYGVMLPVSVNISRIDINDSNVEEEILSIISHFALEPKNLHLEITESGYSEDMGRLIDVVKSFREKGFLIEMDDFGSGYSSLNMLSTLPIDILKMDMKFIRDVKKDKKNFRMIELIIDIAEFLSVPVVAEGVEDESQYKMLKDAGCDMIQGYYFSKPLPAEEFERFVKELAEKKRQ